MFFAGTCIKLKTVMLRTINCTLKENYNGFLMHKKWMTWNYVGGRAQKMKRNIREDNDKWLQS